MAETIGDEGAFDVGELLVRVVVGTERSGAGGTIESEVFGEAEECFGRTKQGVGGSLLGYLFATDAILLFSEDESAGEHVRFFDFIQSWVRAKVAPFVSVRETDGDGSVADSKRLGALFVCITGVGVFRWAEKPVEGDDGEVNDMLVGKAVGGVSLVEDFIQLADDWDVGRIGALGGVVLVPEGLEKRSE